MCNLYREPSIDASYQVLVHLAKRFQKRILKCEKLTDDGRQLMETKITTKETNTTKQKKNNKIQQTNKQKHFICISLKN